MLGVMLARLKESAIALPVSPSTEASAAVRAKPVMRLMPVPSVMTEAPRANEASLSPVLGFFSPAFFGVSDVSSPMLACLPPFSCLPHPEEPNEQEDPAHHHYGEGVEPAGEDARIDLPEDEVPRLHARQEPDPALLFHRHRNLKDVLLRLERDLLDTAMGERQAVARKGESRAYRVARPVDYRQRDRLVGGADREGACLRDLDLCQLEVHGPGHPGSVRKALYLPGPLAPDVALAVGQVAGHGREQEVARLHHRLEALILAARAGHLGEIVVRGRARFRYVERVVLQGRNVHDALRER